MHAVASKELLLCPLVCGICFLRMSTVHVSFTLQFWNGFSEDAKETPLPTSYGGTRRFVDMPRSLASSRGHFFMLSS
jgi:hypothetical protein